MPQIAFYEDDTVDEMYKVDALFKKIKNDSEEEQINCKNNTFSIFLKVAWAKNFLIFQAFITPNNILIYFAKTKKYVDCNQRKNQQGKDTNERASNRCFNHPYE